ncbi:Hypothetical protein FKW44_023887 [Caligus rogercresseyi]|uniref:Uncharacterized protein n=1 Tax=Caligus rogercresseyi TaxID=217165 RepID=A0A7T8GQ34_CALRO|nr:Hypothetical protein FKW44_023887 [Caligus rogercresseyi]
MTMKALKIEEDEQVEKTSHEPRNEDIKEEPITPNESMDMSGEDFIDLEDLDGEPPLLVIKPKVLYRRRKSSFDDRRGSPRRRDNSSQEKEVTVTAATTTKAEDEKPQNDENCDKFDSILMSLPKSEVGSRRIVFIRKEQHLL